MAASRYQTLRGGLLSIPAGISEEEEEPTSPFVIKNTFIEMLEDSTPKLARRSVSAPPLTNRVSVELVERAPDKVDLPRVKRTSRAWSTASTAEHGEQEHIDRRTDDSASCTDESISDANDPCSPRLPLSLDALVAPTARAKLNSKAKAWAPQRPTDCTLTLPPEVQNRFAEVAAAGQAALHACAHVHAVAKSDQGNGWSVVGTVHPSYLRDALQVIPDAKTAIMNAAKSVGVHIIGCDTAPFMPSSGGRGFSVHLAIVRDDRVACWDHLKTGFCKRASACKWQHPAWRVSVNFSLSCSR